MSTHKGRWLLPHQGHIHSDRDGAENRHFDRHRYGFEQPADRQSHGHGLAGVNPHLLSGPDLWPAFSQTNNCGTTLAAGATCTFQVKFSPTSATALTASPFFWGGLAIFDDDPASPQTVRFSALGTGVALAPANLTFGSQPVGTSSAPLLVTLTNSSSNTLTFAGIVASSNFSETDNCLGGVPSGQSCTVSVVFTPSAKGIVKGTLTINTNDIGSPATYNLTGTGS